MIRRPPRSTQSRSSAASDVYKRQYLLKTSASASPGSSISRPPECTVTTTDFSLSDLSIPEEDVLVWKTRFTLSSPSHILSPFSTSLSSVPSGRTRCGVQGRPLHHLPGHDHQIDPPLERHPGAHPPAWLPQAQITPQNDPRAGETPQPDPADAHPTVSTLTAAPCLRDLHPPGRSCLRVCEGESRCPGQRPAPASLPPEAIPRFQTRR